MKNSSLTGIFALPDLSETTPSRRTVMKLAGADAEGCNFAATNVTPGETFPHLRT